MTLLALGFALGSLFTFALVALIQRYPKRALALFVGFLPLLAFAQAPAASPAAAEPTWLVMLNAAWPVLVAIVLVPALGYVCTSGLPKLMAWTEAKRDQAQASAAQKTFFAALVPVEHFAEKVAATVLADMKANPGKSPKDAAGALVPDLKLMLGQDGIDALKEEAGIGGDALTSYLQHAIAAKVQAAQDAQAAAAGAKMAEKVAAMPLAEVAKGLAGAPPA